MLSGMAVIAGWCNLHAQPFTASVANSSLVGYQIGRRDANSQVWQKVVKTTDARGYYTYQTNPAYVELATGLNHWDDNRQQWVASSEEIDVLPDGSGAVATNGQHQVYFPADIYNGEIRMVTPDGKLLRSRPLGLSYDDGTGTVLIAELTNSIGQLLSSNQVIYPDAFVGVKADLLYTYTRAGFEQDIVIREQPPAPEDFNMSSQNSKLQLLTEFFDPPQPTIIGDATDEQLGFGTMQMVPGRAFLLGAAAQDMGATVQKQWVNVSGRQILVEQVPVMTVANELLTLPQSTTTKASPSSPLYVVSAKRLLPAQHLAKVNNESTFMTKAALPDKGLVLDYQTLNSNQTNYTFRGDTTYFLSGAFILNGTNNIIEGGAVLKYTNSAAIWMGGGAAAVTLISRAGPYRMAVLTSMNDNSVGETITTSTGNPTNTGSIYLKLLTGSVVTNSTLAYLRFAYAGTAIEEAESYVDTTVNPVWDCQFLNCGAAIRYDSYANSITFGLYNDLFSNCGIIVTNNYGIYHGKVAINGQNLTVDAVTNLLATWSGDTYAHSYSSLANSLLTGVTHQIYYADTGGSATISTNHCYATNNNAGIYAAGPLGNYYLPTNSPFIDAGNETAVAAGLGDFTTQTNQMPDTGTVDLGYHYAITNASFGDDFWLAFPSTQIADGDSGATVLSLYISSPVAASVTVSAPGVWADGSTLIVTNCDHTSANGTYTLTNITSQERETICDSLSDYYGYLDVSLATAMYGNNTNLVCSDTYRWYIIGYNSEADSCVVLYSSDCNNSLNENNDWQYNFAGYISPTITYCPQVLFNKTISVFPGMATNVEITLNAMITNYDMIGTNGIHVTADAPVSVYGFDYIYEGSTAFTAYPTPFLGTNYCLMARASEDYYNGEYGNSELAVVGTATNTTVWITPSAAANLTNGQTTTYSITLNQGQTYQIDSSDYTGDVTGTTVTSTKPIAVFAGANLAYVPGIYTTSGNPLEQEQLPVNDWGTNVVAMGFAGRLNGDSYRILSYTNTTVTITGTVVLVDIDDDILGTTNETVTTNLTAETPCDIILEGSAQFQSTKPIQVAQFANGNDFSGQPGDPSEILLPPAGHYNTTCTFYIPGSLDYFHCDFSTNYPYEGLYPTNCINLIIAQSGTNATLLDGIPVAAANFTAIGSSGYYGAQIPVSAGSHTVNSSQPVEAQVYGFGFYDAYSYLGGLINFP
jgi:IgGFc binding protein